MEMSTALGRASASGEDKGRREPRLPRGIDSGQK